LKPPAYFHGNHAPLIPAAKALNAKPYRRDHRVSGRIDLRTSEKNTILASTLSVAEKDGLSRDPADNKTKAAVGFEPTNNGFAIRRLNPLGHAAGLRKPL
jgi:hypothetical protein